MYRDRAPSTDGGRRLQSTYLSSIQSGRRPEQDGARGPDSQPLARSGSDFDWDRLAIDGATPEWLETYLGRLTPLTRFEWCENGLRDALRAVEAGVPPALLIEFLGHDLDASTLFSLRSILSGPIRGGWLRDTAPRILTELIDRADEGPSLWEITVDLVAADRTGMADSDVRRWRAATGWGQPIQIGMLNELCAHARRWTKAAGPSAWAWAAAGYSLVETTALAALPAGHPDRPGPDQLAVMAALQPSF